ncbi:nucleotidyl transferase AbiEii/AbiGii toxin family protein [bacterium]|nr:nucleotidyl transferase AbiEii/AbiGii toxin family protein [bacterium]
MIKNIALIKIVAHALGDLNQGAVFVGGATLPFYIPQKYWPQVRPTEDIDVVTKVIGRMSNWKQDDALREKGFKNDFSQGAPICRWKYNDIIVDIMSIDEKVFGFSNRWYSEGLKNCRVTMLDEQKINILSVPYFLATKIEAFQDRGKGNYLYGKDIEDIISVFEVLDRDLFKAEIQKTSAELKNYLKEKILDIKNSSQFQDSAMSNTLDRQNTTVAFKNILNNMEYVLNIIAK